MRLKPLMRCVRHAKPGDSYHILSQGFWHLARKLNLCNHAKCALDRRPYVVQLGRLATRCQFSKPGSLANDLFSESSASSTAFRSRRSPDGLYLQWAVRFHRAVKLSRRQSHYDKLACWHHYGWMPELARIFSFNCPPRLKSLRRGLRSSARPAVAAGVWPNWEDGGSVEGL